MSDKAETGALIHSPTRGLWRVCFLFAPNGASQPVKATIDTLNGGKVRGLDMTLTNPVERMDVGDLKAHLSRKCRALVGWSINGTHAAANMCGDIDWANTDVTADDAIVRFIVKARDTGTATDVAAGANSLISVDLTFLTLDRG